MSPTSFSSPTGRENFPGDLQVYFGLLSTTGQLGLHSKHSSDRQWGNSPQLCAQLEYKSKVGTELNEDCVKVVLEARASVGKPGGGKL